MQELQEQMRKLQESQSHSSVSGSGEPVCPDKPVSKETMGSGDSAQSGNLKETRSSTSTPTTTTTTTTCSTTTTDTVSGCKSNSKSVSVAAAAQMTTTTPTKAEELSTALLAQQLPPLSTVGVVNHPQKRLSKNG